MRIVIVVLCVFLSTVPGAAQVDLRYANQLIEEGWTALEDGRDLESAGDLWRAQGAYEYASNAAGQALTIGDEVGVPFYERPTSPYFLFGQAELHRAQLLYSMGAPWPEIEFSLHRARQAFDDIFRLIDHRFPKGSPEWVEMRSEVLFSQGSVYFLLGDLDTADVINHELEMLRPRSYPADQLQDAIDYTRGQTDSIGSLPRTKLPSRPTDGISGERFVAYAIEIGKALFGRWGTIAGMVVEDLYEAAQ